MFLLRAPFNTHTHTCNRAETTAEMTPGTTTAGGLPKAGTAARRTVGTGAHLTAEIAARQKGAARLTGGIAATTAETVTAAAAAAADGTRQERGISKSDVSLGDRHSAHWLIRVDITFPKGEYLAQSVPYCGDSNAFKAHGHSLVFFLSHSISMTLQNQYRQHAAHIFQIPPNG
jgi:hypothetical protein